jgi:acyl-CoA reductase-like NAD-dependent aldehyde dehydrogenase
MTQPDDQQTAPLSPTQAESELTDYAARVREHWATFLPKRYAAIPEAERAPLFEAMGEEIDQQITDLAETLAAQALTESRQWTAETEPYQETVKRLETARRAAESDLLRELLPVDDVLPGDVPDDRTAVPPEDNPIHWLSRDQDGDSAQE